MVKDTICVIGGGAAGFFAAIQAAQKIRCNKQDAIVILLEGSTRFLQKVRISGGGRCNVTHHDYNIRSFCTRYPRGQKEVLSPMHQFQASDLVQWFEGKGIELKVEDDGRMFPATNNSETIIDCLQEQAALLDVQLDKGFYVESVTSKNGSFVLKSRKGKALESSRILLATGSSPDGYKIASKLGHSITALAPSLFSFKITSSLLQGMQGTSFPKANVALHISKKNEFQEQAPLLITHWGLSGPGVLKISAWAARKMKDAKYKGLLTVNWTGIKTHDMEKYLADMKRSHPNIKIGNLFIQGVTKKFWKQILTVKNISENILLGQVAKKDIGMLALVLTRTELQVDGKNRFKEEFVECGGVNLKEIDMKTMQSKLVPGLFFAGEVMDVDGVTGGFNLQHAWTSGWVAGRNITES